MNECQLGTDKIFKPWTLLSSRNKSPCKVPILAMLIATVATLREALTVNVTKDIPVLVKNVLIGTNVS